MLLKTEINRIFLRIPICFLHAQARPAARYDAETHVFLCCSLHVAAQNMYYDSYTM